MKKYLHPFILLLLFSCLQACGIDLLDIELPAGEPKLVVEASISNQAGPALVNLSWSRSFNSSYPHYEENALVILSDSEGGSDTLRHISEGRYESSLTGQPGLRYQLSIYVNGLSYQASSHMPQPARYDSIRIEYQPERIVFPEGYYISLYNLDPDEKEAYYRWKIWVNDTLLANNVPNGFFTNRQLGNHEGPLNLQYPYPFKKGDHLRIQGIKMDQDVYQYYQEMIQMMLNDGGLLGPVPHNPASNISNGALGIFQANAIGETELIIE